MWSLCSFGFRQKSLHSHLVGGIKKKKSRRKKTHSGVENLGAQSLEERRLQQGEWVCKLRVVANILCLFGKCWNVRNVLTSHTHTHTHK